MKIEKKELLDLQRHIARKIAEIQFSANPNPADLFDLNMLDSNISLLLLNAEFHDGPLELGVKDRLIKDALKKFMSSKENKVEPSAYTYEASAAAAEIIDMIHDTEEKLNSCPNKILVQNLLARFAAAESLLAQVAKLRDAGKRTLSQWEKSEIPLPTVNSGKARTQKKATSTEEEAKKSGRPRKATAEGARSAKAK